jgi:pimeloyl-ACP methyl ester carboxylesterase
MITMAWPGPASRAADRTLLVMLPGAHLSPSEFAEHGFVAELRARHAAVDAIAVALNSDDYLAGDVAARLHDAVIAPAMARGYARLWLLGISLGGMGALLHARAYPQVVDGAILLAPFLATRGTIAEVIAAGGLDAWEPGPLPSTDIERGLLSWLKSRPFPLDGRPMLLLGHGAADRYADASRLLYGQVPPAHVAVTDGGHDWPTWTKLWRLLLDVSPMAAKAAGD